MPKRGNTLKYIVVSILVIIVLASAGLIIYDKYFKKEIVKLECSEEKLCSEGFKCSNGICLKERIDIPPQDSTVRVAVYNRVGTSVSQLTSGNGLYVWSRSKFDDNPEISVDGGSITTPRQAVNTQVGNLLNLAYFSQGFSGYYAIPIKDFLVEGQQPDLDLTVYRAVSSNIRFAVRNGTEDIVRGYVNVSIPGANSQGSFREILLEQNETDRAFYLYGIGFTTNASVTAVKDISIGSGRVIRASRSDREGFEDDRGIIITSDGTLERTRLNFFFKTEYPILMLFGDTVRTGSIVYQTGSTGCSNEEITVSAIDGNYFIGTSDKALKFGAENDDNVPTDMGVPDITLKTGCTG